MKEYELTVLVHPDLEMNLDPALAKIKKIIGDAGGKITKEDLQGKRKLAYQINKQDFAVYVFFELDLPAPAPLKISNIFNITDEVLRYLLVKKDLRVTKEETAGDEESSEKKED